ncbi:hypothetical protein ACWDTI_00090 [Gordonia sp. NPDC003424]
MNDRTIYVVDQVVLQPGKGREFIDAYLSEYAPGAVDRGLTLDRVLVSPPVWLDDEPTTVTALWTVAGPAAWWHAAIRGRHDLSTVQWWESVAPLIVRRSRSMAAAAADVEGLCDV